MTLTIGQVAKTARVNIETIRYYERRGLFPTAPRTAAGYRQYTDGSVRRLRFIKRAQRLGFSLKEIEELLALRVRRNTACDSVERKAHAKIAVVDRKLEELVALRQNLQRLVQACAGREPTADCPILEQLEDPVLADANPAAPGEAS